MTVIYSLHGNTQHKLLKYVMKPREKAAAGSVWEPPAPSSSAAALQNGQL